MRYIEFPEIYNGSNEPSIFLAGGITDCPDWQEEVVEMLAESTDVDLVLLNPRSKYFPIHVHDPNASFGQIKWEFDHLRKASAILFWFPCETLCPIVLYQLGSWSMAGNKPIFVGVHPNYKRRQDVEIQTSLILPHIKIVSSLEKLVEQVNQFFRLINPFVGTECFDWIG